MRRYFKIIVAFLAVIAVAGICVSFLTSLTGSDTDKTKPAEPQKNNPPIETKYISFLGDSITTYEGYSNSANNNSTTAGNGVYYTASKLGVNETWWYQTMKATGMKLCVNNSWDGGRVTDTKPGITSGIARASELHNDVLNITPDVIVVYIGTNDLANGINVSDFEIGYEEMLNVIDSEYPGADVYCCTILPESRNVNKADELISYNETIRNLADQHNAKIIDFATEITDWDYTVHTFVDGSLRVHPTAEGMSKLSDVAIREIKG